VPGYESDDSDSESDPALEEYRNSKAEAAQRFQLVVDVLGQRWLDRPFVNFVPGKRPQKHIPGTSPLRRTWLRKDTSASVGPTACFYIERADAPLVRETFLASGLVSNDRDWIVQWSAPNLRDNTYQSLHEYQHVNHFPGATEMSRKNRLWTNFHEMAQVFGDDTFDFIPETYVLPQQADEFMECFKRTSYLWIVKPHASSQGRGIFLLRDVSELKLKEISVSRYVHNPLLIQGLKFDLRVYVLVTSFDPLRAYVYREGLTRFACKPYSVSQKHLKDVFRHLTNYSINKSAANFVENQQLEADNVGHKWSLSALNKHLKCVGVDVHLMWTRIMDLIMKTLLAVEPPISARTRELTQGRSNCFELYGFDVLVDDSLKPWLLEVNLSPSMRADSPLDWQVKSTLLADAFNLVGMRNVDRATANVAKMRSQMRASPSRRPPPMQSSKTAASKTGPPTSASLDVSPTSSSAKCIDERPVVLDTLTEVQLKMLAKGLEEQGRCRNFICLYPTRASVERYATITEARSLRPRELARSSYLRGPRIPSINLQASVFFGPKPLRSMSDPRRQNVANVAKLADGTPLDPETASAAALRKRRAGSFSHEACDASPSVASTGTGAPSTTTHSTSTSDHEDAEDAAEETELVRGGMDAKDASFHDSERQAALLKLEDLIRVMGSRVGCRLVLMEYLIRLKGSCDTLTARERAEIAQSSSYARLSDFQDKLAALSSALDSGGCHMRCVEPLNTLGSARSVGSDFGGGLVDELAASCKRSLALLEQDAQRDELERESQDSPRSEASASSSTRGSDPDICSSSLAKRLPAAFLQTAAARDAMKVLPNLGAIDLERILRSAPFFTDEKKTLLDSFDARGPRHDRTPRVRAVGACHVHGTGRGGDPGAQPQSCAPDQSAASVIEHAGEGGGLGPGPIPETSQPADPGRSSCSNGASCVDMPTGPLTELLQMARLRCRKQRSESADVPKARSLQAEPSRPTRGEEVQAASTQPDGWSRRWRRPAMRHSRSMEPERQENITNNTHPARWARSSSVSQPVSPSIAARRPQSSAVTPFAPREARTNNESVLMMRSLQRYNRPRLDLPPRPFPIATSSVPLLPELNTQAAPKQHRRSEILDPVSPVHTYLHKGVEL